MTTAALIAAARKEIELVRKANADRGLAVRAFTLGTAIRLVDECERLAARVAEIEALDRVRKGLEL